ncbi:MAG: polyprenyl synthetase family protein [Candidatus Omnitrophica bacterium]|nr:polyprenyl synthetase family protein [Candidatus Omnitrophota bacterium]
MSLIEIRSRLERLLPGCLKELEDHYCLSRISSLLTNGLRNFVLRPGKRLRPIMMVIGYLGYAKRPAPGLFQAALAFEVLHDFMLIHDDIVDRAAIRRGQPSLHCLFQSYLSSKENVKLTGVDFALVAGDVLYAAAIEMLLQIKVRPEWKEKALQRFVSTAFLTGVGQFAEMELGTRALEQSSREEILRVYDLKTAKYTFAGPLTVGATLAGVPGEQLDSLERCGLYLGRAFQIRDDIHGLFKEEKETGKSPLTDLNEAKKTLLLWYAFQQGKKEQELYLNQLMTGGKANRVVLERVRDIVTETGGLKYAEEEIKLLLAKASYWGLRSGMKKSYRQQLLSYAREVLIGGNR